MGPGENLHSKIQATWLLRWNQRIEESMRGLAEIQDEAGWSDLDLDRLTKFESAKEKEDYIEVLLLNSSHLRAQGLLQKSSSWLRRILQKSDELFDFRGFRILFEMAMDHWVHEDTAQAMECFYLAEKRARNAAEKFYSLFNLLLCLEAIDLPREDLEEKLKFFISSEGREPAFRHLSEQWQAYQLRKSFYQKLEVDETKSYAGQAAFFKSWALALPYVSENWQERIQFDLQKSHLWQGAYRARTLTGLWLPADLESPRITDAVDRLYLWTWWWMAGQASMTTDKIIWTLESICDTLDIDSECKDILFLLRNALSWIALTEPRLEVRVSKLLRGLKKLSSPRYPVLEVEFALTQSLINDPNAEIEKHLGAFPCFARIRNELKCASSASALLKRLHERLSPFQTAESEACQLVIDLATHEVKVMNTYQVLKSERLAHMLYLLHESGRARFDEFMKDDEELDPPKVYNLVARARKLTANTALRVCGEEVVRGPGWPRVMVLHEPFEKNPTLTLESQKISSVVDSESHLQAARALLPANFVRKDLEKILRISKSTACRMIEKWLNDDVITSKGQAKAKKYSWC